jgi:hypothetical protein
MKKTIEWRVENTDGSWRWTALSRNGSYLARSGTTWSRRGAAVGNALLFGAPLALQLHNRARVEVTVDLLSQSIETVTTHTAEPVRGRAA